MCLPRAHFHHIIRLCTKFESWTFFIWFHFDVQWRTASSLSRRTISSIHYYRSYIGLRQVTCTHITCHNFIFPELKARGIWDANIISALCCLPKTYVMNLSYCKTLAILHSHWDRRRVKGNNVTNWSYISMILGGWKIHLWGQFLFFK